MEANGQQETPRGQGLVLQAHWQTRKVGIWQYSDRCLEERTERFVNWSAWRGPETSATLAVASLVGRMASTIRALPVKGWGAAGNTGGVLALTSMHTVRAAAHHQVDYQYRDAQVVEQPGHTTTTPSSPVIGGKVSLSSGKVASAPPRGTWCGGATAILRGHGPSPLVWFRAPIEVPPRCLRRRDDLGFRG